MFITLVIKIDHFSFYDFVQIGNAVINDETDEQGMYDFMANHALISDHSASAIQKHCDFSPNATRQPPECDTAIEEANKDVYYLDIYNIYAPACASSNLTSKPKTASVSTTYTPICYTYLYNLGAITLIFFNFYF